MDSLVSQMRFLVGGLLCGAAFMLVGLALLHRVTRGMGARPAILGLVYGALLMLSPFSSLLVAMVGLAEPYLRTRQPPPGPAPPGI